MNALYLALGILAAGAGTAAVTGRKPVLCSWVGSASAVVGSMVGLYAALGILTGGAPVETDEPLPGFLHGSFVVGADALSGFFLVAVFLLGGIAAAYGRDYWLGGASHRRLGRSWLVFNLFLASLALVLIARDALLFLVAWEAMSILAFLLVSTEHDQAEVRRAGWVYLIATHIGTAFITAMFLVLARLAGSLHFQAFSRLAVELGAQSGGGWAALLFGLAVVGFGVKAGFAPSHVWLPEAHAAAPSHVSALMSGVLIKIGLYGLLRTLTFLGTPAGWWGVALMVIGLAGALLGVGIGSYQRDMKRVLAYSSIENIGLITLSLGVGLWARASGLRALAAIGTAGALMHLWNHTLMKGLMFLSAGSVLHGAGTKDLEHLGGLMKRMPRTGTLMVLGATAISALPPMNGFTSEWLIYLGLIGGGRLGGTGGMAFFLAAGALAAIGGIACLCFVRLVGTSLLGQPRSESARRAHESPSGMIVPMAALALLCAGAAVFPRAVLSLIGSALSDLLGGFATAEDAAAGAPLVTLGALNAALIVALGIGGWALFALQKKRPAESGQTWGCGYLAPSERMQYTGRSIAELLSEHLFPRAFRPKIFHQRLISFFAPKSELSSDVSDPLTRGVYEPFMAGWASRLLQLRWLQQGNLQLYVSYVVIISMLLLGWLSLRGWIAP